MDPVNVPAKFEVLSFTRFWDNRGYSKNLGISWIRPRSIFSQNFKVYLFGWTLWIYLPNLKFVALSWGNRGYSKNLGSPCICQRSIFSQIFNRVLFAWTIWIRLPNLTFVALPTPEIIGGTSKIWGVPGFTNPPYSPKFFMGLCSDGPVNVSAKFAIRSFSRSWDNSDCSFGMGCEPLILVKGRP